VSQQFLALLTSAQALTPTLHGPSTLIHTHLLAVLYPDLLRMVKLSCTLYLSVDRHLSPIALKQRGAPILLRRLERRRENGNWIDRKSLSGLVRFVQAVLIQFDLNIHAYREKFKSGTNFEKRYSLVREIM